MPGIRIQGLGRTNPTNRAEAPAACSLRPAGTQMLSTRVLIPIVMKEVRSIIHPIVRLRSFGVCTYYVGSHFFTSATLSRTCKKTLRTPMLRTVSCRIWSMLARVRGAGLRNTPIAESARTLCASSCLSSWSMRRSSCSAALALSRRLATCCVAVGGPAGLPCDCGCDWGAAAGKGAVAAAAAQLMRRLTPQPCPSLASLRV